MTKSTPKNASTRAEILAHELEARMPVMVATGVFPVDVGKRVKAKVVKQADTVGMDALKKRRDALAKLRTFVE